MKNATMNTSTSAGRQAITEALKIVQGRATARTLTLEDIDRILERVEARLDVPRCKLAGTRVYWTGGEHFPAAYRYRPESTQLEAVHDGRKWQFTRLFRGTCPNHRSNVSVQPSDLTLDALRSRLAALEI